VLKAARRVWALPGDFLGHPKGLAFLFASEMWERFSYYGMRALLVLYMVNHLLAPERAERAWGLAHLRRLLQFFSGPLAAQPLASLIYGLYTGFVYLTRILGGMVADRWLGRARTVALGASLMVLGHFMMADERLFLIALALLIVGNGAFKPNISTQVGELYGVSDPRRDRAYSIFYVGINIGAFLAPLVCGTLGEKVGWHYGFAAAGVGMAVGLFAYLTGLPVLPPDPIARAAAPAPASSDLRRALLCIFLLLPSSALFWAAFEQQGNTITLWAEQFTDRGVNLFGREAEIPVTWFQAFNPLMIFVFTPPLVGWWAGRARRGREPSTIDKLALGCWGAAVSYLILAVAAAGLDSERANWLWLLAYFAVITLAELHFSPIALSLVSRLAPMGSRSALMGLWLASMFVGNLLAGWIGAYWSSLSRVEFFLLVAALPAVAGLLVPGARRRL
jgi:POT family proton-dependent oligopeptide transporter